MIQVVTYSGREVKYQGKDVEQYSLHDIRSLDEYDITVIDLGNPNLWQYSENGTSSIDSVEDLKSISEMIMRSEKSEIVIVLPQNLTFRYYQKSSGNGHYYDKELKNMLESVSKSILSRIYAPISSIRLLYENTKSMVDNVEYDASFYFDEETDVLLRSIRSNKPTAIKKGDIILTTLLFSDYSALEEFLNKIGLLEQPMEIPEWIYEMSMFDDAEQKEQIRQCEELIKNNEKKIAVSEKVLDSNNRMKSILYSNGDELVEVVFEILEEMLGCNLSSFVDEKKEDFLFNIEDYVFIGEIKGVTHNVKNQNVTQLDVHYQGYLDDNEETDQGKIKALLIINHQRNKPVLEREPIKDTQIKLAERNGSLIVDTYTLLRVLEKYRKGELSREKILKMLKDQIGHMNID